MHIDENELDQFLGKCRRLERDIDEHNNTFVTSRVAELEDYFDHIMDEVDQSINLDLAQRRAIVTDDDHCLVVAGAGAGKTTTMAAKVKYLVDTQGVAPEEVIVVSYTNKAINELKERINKRLKIPVEIATFHSFAYDIIRKHRETPPEVNISSYNTIFEMLACQGRCENVPAGRSKTVPLNAVEWASRFVGRWRSGSVR